MRTAWPRASSPIGSLPQRCAERYRHAAGRLCRNREQGGEARSSVTGKA
ncbi:hypothetical protein [Lysobacter gummosus]